MNLCLKRTPGIYLVGFMGCGKSTVGRMLAAELGWTFLDLDHEIEAEQQVSLAHIFDTLGEAQFREIETEALRRRVRKIQCGRATVLALGGGAFVQPENVKILAGNGASIWLDCPLDLIRQRIAHATHRPLARDPEKLERLYQARREHYARADFRVEFHVDNSSLVTRQVLALPIFTK